MCTIIVYIVGDYYCLALWDTKSSERVKYILISAHKLMVYCECKSFLNHGLIMWIVFTIENDLSPTMCTLQSSQWHTIAGSFNILYLLLSAKINGFLVVTCYKIDQIAYRLSCN